MIRIEILLIIFQGNTRLKNGGTPKMIIQREGSIIDYYQINPNRIITTKYTKYTKVGKQSAFSFYPFKVARSPPFSHSSFDAGALRPISNAWKTTVLRLAYFFQTLERSPTWFPTFGKVGPRGLFLRALLRKNEASLPMVESNRSACAELNNRRQAGSLSYIKK